MKKTKYQPKAWDVCEYSIFDKIVKVLIVSPEPIYDETDLYLAVDDYYLKNIEFMAHCYCELSKLKLIYRP